MSVCVLTFSVLIEISLGWSVSLLGQGAVGQPKRISRAPVLFKKKKKHDAFLLRVACVEEAELEDIKYLGIEPLVKSSFPAFHSLPR